MVGQQTTVYGHHMSDGSMFDPIENTLDQAKFDEMTTVYYLTPETTYKLSPLFTSRVPETYVEARQETFGDHDALVAYLEDLRTYAKGAGERRRRTPRFDRSRARARHLQRPCSRRSPCRYDLHDRRGNLHRAVMRAAGDAGCWRCGQAGNVARLAVWLCRRCGQAGDVDGWRCGSAGAGRAGTSTAGVLQPNRCCAPPTGFIILTVAE